MKKVSLLLFVTIILISCKEIKYKEEVSNLNIEIKTEKISNQEIKTFITTNFPENTAFTITVSRDYKRQNNGEQYAGELYYTYNSNVKNSSIEFTFDIDDMKWINEYKKIQKQNAEFDKSLTDIDFSSIKDSIEINVLFTPKAQQSNNVKELLGVNGENLKGKGTEDNGSFKIFTKTIKIYDKFKIQF
ncbi:hypothetical protein [uncultured Kordia sp.]|uniref:hypothetical protein n=1 Tax=uncultured Kordia sp. TaxID=507699 RepID=UPI002637BF3B|nr:hypothetical protein [uncultured Kordia sp.]